MCGTSQEHSEKRTYYENGETPDSTFYESFAFVWHICVLSEVNP